MSTSTAKKQLSAVQHAALGMASGTIEVCIMQPTIFLKNASQQGMALSMSPSVLYRGLGVSVLNMGVMTGVQMPLTSMVSKLVTGGEERSLSGKEMVASGFLGGLLSGLICGPMELVMIQQQRFGLSLVRTPASIAQTHGMTGFFRGLAPTCLREAIFTAGYLGLGPALKDHLESTGSSSTNAKLISAVVAGVASSTLSHPVDTIKTCLQGDIKQERYTSLSQSIKLVAQEGYTVFFRGWGWRAGRTVCSVFIINEARERLAWLF